MTMTSANIRRAFLDFFASKQHQIVPSSSLIPGNDATLLFTNAGMVQFKDVFLGQDKRNYSRAVSSQRCVRAGGKHNDLENVGYTARHHTFFEMLGNFSFGDYFKREAIQYAWQFLTEEVKLPKEKLLVTVYETDDEAYAIWLNEIGVPAERIIRIGDNKGAPYASDNFWAMGDTGPCGPCSEIFYDHGDHIWGGPPGSAEEDGDRFIEIWNIVFMQFNRQADGTMEPLPKPSVDTGMGLERIAAILQNVHSNYEIDTFVALINAAAKITGATDHSNKSLRVVADHIRSCAFLIVDGVQPSNEGRGYVLRRIIRRAVRHGNQLGAKGAFFYQLVAELINQMGEAYPELAQKQAVIEKIIKLEEEQFGKTLERGLVILEQALQQLEGTVLPGDLVFKLYDTYGFPVDLTNDVARERNLTIDHDGFDAAMAEQRKRAQQASNFSADYNANLTTEQQSDFTGYNDETNQANVLELIKDSQVVAQLNDGETGLVILDQTPFYAESGGQVGDTGTLSLPSGAVFKVEDTIKLSNAIAHKGKMLGSIKQGDSVNAQIDSGRRAAIKQNHSATHLLHAALRQVLGEHVTQKGSLVQPDRLRFDFSHFSAVTADELRRIEQLVNEQIQQNHQLNTRLMSIEQAKEAGAMALFGEKYDDDEVRVLSMGEFSIELCGGTHVKRTGDIGLVKLVSEAGISSGVRRIEACSGSAAVAYVQQLERQAQQVAAAVKGDVLSIAERVEQSLERSKSLEKEIDQLKAKLASQASASILDQAEEIAGVTVLIAQLPATEPKALRTMLDQLKNKLNSAVILLATVNNDKISLIAGVTSDTTNKVHAGKLVGWTAEKLGGKGGGRPDMAQAGGTDVQALASVLKAAKTQVSEQLS